MEDHGLNLDLDHIHTVTQNIAHYLNAIVTLHLSEEIHTIVILYGIQSCSTVLFHQVWFLNLAVVLNLCLTCMVSQTFTLHKCVAIVHKFRNS